MNTRIILLLTVFAGLQTVNEVNATTRKQRAPVPRRDTDPTGSIAASGGTTLPHSTSAPTLFTATDFPPLGAPAPKRTPTPSPSTVTAPMFPDSPRGILAGIERAYATRQSHECDKWGGHCYRDHVGLRSLTALVDRKKPITSRFLSEATARESIEFALSSNQQLIDGWIAIADKIRPRHLELPVIDTTKVCGEAASASKEVIRGMTKVQLVIRYSPISPSKYAIETAYPI